MSILALDLGEKRTGVAVSDSSNKIALPLTVISTPDVLNNAPAFKRLFEDYEIELILIGLPFSLDGKENAQARRIRVAAEQLKEHHNQPVEFVDERLSSVEAKNALRQMGYSEKEMRTKTDKIAACIILQKWLDSSSVSGAQMGLDS